MNEQIDENRIRVVLLDNQTLFRGSLGRLLASEPDVEMTGECGTSKEALEVLHRLAVDLVLLNFDLGSEHGNEFISAALEVGYRGRFLIVTDTVDARRSAIALKLGASGIFLKSDAPNRLLQAIRLVASGEVWVDQRVIRLLAEKFIDRYPQPDDQGPGRHMTDREQKVIRGILGGLTNKKIGGNMGLSEGSVKSIVQRLFVKAGVRTRSQLVRAALEGSLGTPQELTKPTRPFSPSETICCPRRPVYPPRQ